MKILPEPISFEWDKGNIDKNFVRHKVTNREAEEVFGNNPLISEDTGHSEKERRYRILGVTDKQRFLFLSFTIRKDKIRIISARDMNKKEVSKYEKA
ncbi:MAG: BrnT family toxin [Nanoarchaeota archaeon]